MSGHKDILYINIHYGKILVVALILLLAIVSGCSNEPDVKETTKMAEAGDAEQQARLGAMYLHGRRVEQDFVKAGGWLEKAAAQGSGRAYYFLGLLHENAPHDSPFERNYEKARVYYEKGAMLGDIDATMHLADLYMGTNHRLDGNRGDYMSSREREAVEDPKKAKDWYEKAADLGNADAQYIVGNMYLNEVTHERKTVVKQDREKAMHYFMKAADQGHKLAQYEAGCMWRTLGNPSSDRQEEIKMEALKTALKYFELSCKQGYVKACHQARGTKDDMERLQKSAQ